MESKVIRDKIRGLLTKQNLLDGSQAKVWFSGRFITNISKADFGLWSKTGTMAKEIC
jgi:hypothetical protein